MGNQKGDGSRKLNLIPAIRSPLSFLAFAAIIADTVFGITGVIQDDQTTIVFTMHMFLAIVATVVLLALWSPKSLYRPEEVKDIAEEQLVDKTGRWVVTIVLSLAMVIYMAYRITKDTSVLTS